MCLLGAVLVVESDCCRRERHPVNQPVADEDFHNHNIITPAKMNRRTGCRYVLSDDSTRLDKASQ